jgi:hypothetical protein
MSVDFYIRKAAYFMYCHRAWKHGYYFLIAALNYCIKTISKYHSLGTNLLVIFVSIMYWWLHLQTF